MARMHLLAPVTEPEALSAYRSGLSAAHAALTARLVTTAGKVTPPPLGAAHWVVQIKRSPVDVGGVPMVPEGVESQPFSEVVNQLATVERLIDALDWAVGQQMDTVEHCNPATSGGRKGSCSHDLVVTGPGGKMVFEVSDVAGASGNGNGKVTKDLIALRGCICKDAENKRAQRFLAVSPSSGDWIKRNHPVLRFQVDGPSPATSIVTV